MTEPGPSGSSVGAGRPTSKQPPPDLGNRLSPTRRSLPPVAIHQENRHRAGWVCSVLNYLSFKEWSMKSTAFLPCYKSVWVGHHAVFLLTDSHLVQFAISLLKIHLWFKPKHWWYCTLTEIYCGSGIDCCAQKLQNNQQFFRDNVQIFVDIWNPNGGFGLNHGGLSCRKSGWKQVAIQFLSKIQFSSKTKNIW